MSRTGSTARAHATEVHRLTTALFIDSSDAEKRFHPALARGFFCLPETPEDVRPGTTPTELECEGEVVNQHTGQPCAGVGAPSVAAGVQDVFLLAGESFEAVAENVIDAFIETHDVDRCDRLTLLHPQAGEAGHAGDAAVVAI